MKTTIFLFHPTSTPSRINKALAEAAGELPDVTIRDMYSLYPDGAIDVAAEQSVLEETDRIVLQFPLYWYATPPLLKQWLDEVMLYGWAFGSAGTALHGKELAVATSAGASGYSHDQVGYTINELLRPLQATSNLIGTRYLTPFAVEGSLGITDAALADRARDYQNYLTSEQAALGAHE